MVHVGVDLHRKTSHVVALDDDGAVVLRRRVGSRPDELMRVFGELEPAPLEVAFEATFGWSWFADLLADAGIPAHMAHPLATKAISSARVKNDSVDAKTLAHLLRSNLLPEAWIAPPEAREARRSLARMRTSLVRLRTRLTCQVHALLAEHCVARNNRHLRTRRQAVPGGTGWSSRRSPSIGSKRTYGWPRRSLSRSPRPSASSDSSSRPTMASNGS